MKPKRIFFVRHAESEGNVNQIVHASTPDWKIPLTEKGEIQANDTAFLLRDKIGVLTPVGIYLSPYKRTRQTAMYLASVFPGQLKFEKEDPRLREQEWGNLRAFEGRPWAEVEQERDFFGPFFYRFLHGESGADVWERCTTFLDTLYRDFEKPDFPENIIIVTHGYTMRILIMRWLHWTVEQFHEMKNPHNGEIVEMKLGEDDKYHLSQPYPKRITRL